MRPSTVQHAGAAEFTLLRAALVEHAARALPIRQPGDASGEFLIARQRDGAAFLKLTGYSGDLRRGLR